MIPSKRIKSLIEEIINLGAVLPGTVTKVYNVCGKKKCKCKDPKSPEKHGPYNLLSFTIAKKSSSKFIKGKDLSSVRSMQESYQRLKAICQELPLAYLDLIKKDDVPAAISLASQLSVEFNSDELMSEKRLMYSNVELNKKVIEWREKSTERAREINALKARVNQLEKSRDNWKKKAMASSDNQKQNNKKKK
jgi:hypothetical protein